jgi:hypothetical protein
MVDEGGGVKLAVIRGKTGKIVGIPIQERIIQIFSWLSSARADLLSTRYSGRFTMSKGTGALRTTIARRQRATP